MWDSASKIITTIAGGIFVVASAIGVFGLFFGGWKSLKEIGKSAKKIGKCADKWDNTINKANLFIDNILPCMLDHWQKTGRIPKNSSSDWTKILSKNNSGSSIESASPLKVSKKGEELANKWKLSIIFDNNKNSWVEELRKQIGNNSITKYDIENEAISFVSKIFINGDKAFNPLKNYMYENPNDVVIADVCTILGIKLRDYFFEKFPKLVSNN